MRPSDLRPRNLRRLPALGVLLAALGAGPPALAAQEGCEFGEDGNDVADRRTLSGGATITYVSNPHFVCADGVQIWADSAVAYSAQGLSHLMGSVRYLDRVRELRSDEARYFSEQDRVQAQGHLYVRDTEDGSIIENGELVYLRQTDFRAEESMTVTTGADRVRPVARIQPATPDSLDAASKTAAGGTRRPYVVVADWIFLQGSERFEAAGDVEIDKDSLLAYADSAEYDRVADRIVLRGSARVDGTTYDLQGRTIDMLTPEGATSQVHAVRDALLTGDELVITSSQIRLYLTEGALDRLVATPLPEDTVADPPSPEGAGGTPPPEDTAATSPQPAGAAPAHKDVTATGTRAQPVALVQDFELTADSIDILAPGEEIERVFAAGTARSVSHSRDSLNVPDLPPIARSDWLEGDTIIVFFEPDSTEALAGTHRVPLPATPDSAAGRYRVDRIRAMIGARSLYRLAPSDTTAQAGVDPPAIHYVVGDSITIVMKGDEVETMEVVGQTQGMHLEPLSRQAVPDSLADTAAVIDTVTGPAGSRPDTARTGFDTVRTRPDGAAGARRPGASARRRWPPAAPPLRSPGRGTEPWRRP